MRQKTQYNTFKLGNISYRVTHVIVTMVFIVAANIETILCTYLVVKHHQLLIQLIQ
jgi:hypothetical protein